VIPTTRRQKLTVTPVRVINQTRAAGKGGENPAVTPEEAMLALLVALIIKLLELD
jgi:hypothetical protein